MDLRKIASRILINSIASQIASRKSDALAKYPHLKNEIDYFLNEINPKYLDYVLGCLAYGQAKKEELVILVSDFEKFRNELEYKDMNKYEYGTLRDELDLLIELRDEKIRKKNERYEKRPDVDGAKTVYESDKFVVRLVRSRKASVYYGGFTKWCVSMKGTPGHWYNHEISNDVFFFIETKNSSLSERKSNEFNKISAEVTRDGSNNIVEIIWWDTKDGVRSESDVTKYLGDESNKIFSIINNVVKTVDKNDGAKLKDGDGTLEERKKTAEGLDGDQLTIFLYGNEGDYIEYDETFADLLRVFVECDNPSIRLAVAEHAGLDTITEMLGINDVLDKLVHDRDERVRYAIVLSNVLPEETIREIYKNDGSEKVRRAIVMSYKCPMDVIKDLLNKTSDVETVKGLLHQFMYGSKFDAGIVRFIYDKFGNDAYINEFIKDSGRMGGMMPKRPFDKSIVSYFALSEGEEGGDVERTFNVHVTDVPGGHQLDLKLIDGPAVDDPSVLSITTNEFWETDDAFQEDVIEKTSIEYVPF